MYCADMALLIIILFICLAITFIGRAKKQISPKRTEKQKQTEELITVILPTMRNDNN